MPNVLVQNGFGAAVAWDSSDLVGLSIDARNNPFGGSNTYGELELIAEGT